MSEAERLAEWLEAGSRSGLWYDSRSAAAELRRLAAVEREYEALKASLGEPVAWRYVRPMGQILLECSRLDYSYHDGKGGYLKGEPLYAITKDKP